MQSLRDTIPKLLRQLDQEDEGVRLLFLQELWSEVAGQRLAGSTSPIGLKGRVLVVEVPDEVWREQLFQFQSELRRSVNRLFGDSVIEKVDFQVGPTGRRRY